MVTACSGFLGMNVFVIPHVLSFHVGKEKKIWPAESQGLPQQVKKQAFISNYTETLRPMKAATKMLWGGGIKNQPLLFTCFSLDFMLR